MSSEIKLVEGFFESRPRSRIGKDARCGRGGGDHGEGADERWQGGQQNRKDHRTERRLDGAADSDSLSCRSGERESTQKERKKRNGPRLPGLNEAEREDIYTQGGTL